MENTKLKSIVLAGGTGFLGMNLARALVKQGRKVVILSRSQPEDGEWTWAKWDGKSQGEWSKVIDGAAAIVNFSGKSIDCYPTPENKRLILSSRVDPIHAIAQAVESAAQSPTVWVQLSAVGIYGNTTSECPESASPGDGFLPEICTQWEQAFHDSSPESMRNLVLRAGVVLGRDEGAFPKLRKIAKLGFGGAAGSGKQGMSWIHEDDMTQILLKAIDDDSMQGTYNASSPSPASNKDFMRSLRKAVGMPFGPPAPAFAVKLGARFVLKTNPDLALEGQYAIPQRLNESGFEFQHPELQSALNHLSS